MQSKNMKLSSIIKTSLLCLSLASAPVVHANAAKQQKDAVVVQATPSNDASPTIAISDSNKPILCQPIQTQSALGSTVAVPGVVFDLSKGFSSIAEATLPAVVNVATTQVLDPKSKGGDSPQFAPGSPFEEFFKDFFDQMERPRKVQSLGSGFIIRSDAQKAYIVTNYHVIADAKKISIFLNDKTELEATVHAYDDRTDLAVLKVNTENLPENKRTLPALQWGNSDISKVGEWVLAIGNPFGLGSTVTAGIISTKGRELAIPTKNQVSDYVDDFIQHSAQINMGNSGGCLLNMEGKVIGINTAIFSLSGGNVGIGFAIPSGVAQKTIDQLIEFGRTKRGWLGVRIQHLTDDMAESLGLKVKGAIVGSVTPDGPAQKAGILSGDVILEFDGKQISENNRLSRLVGETTIGKTCKVKVWRKGEEITLDITVGEFEDALQKGKLEMGDKKSPISPEQTIEVLGMKVTPIPNDIKEKSKQKDMKGVLVTNISNTSPALDARMRPGDIIVEVNQKEILTTKDLTENVEAAKKAKRKNILLLVMRNEEPHYFTIKLEDELDQSKPKEDQQSKKEGASTQTPLAPSKPEAAPGGKDKSAPEGSKQNDIPDHPANRQGTTPVT
ncbi:MAG: Do family serine endopeptidase [Alphaproteobacteria bacterium]|nr:Do family serine endopeptidase [Alphaproteobacteria bacterium]